MKVRKYVIRNNKKTCKDMYFGGWGMLVLTEDALVLTGEVHPLWYNRDSEDVYKFFSKSEARDYARRLTKNDHKVKIIKLKRAERVYEKGGDN